MGKSKIDLVTNEEFTVAYINNSDYTNMARSLGYGKNINYSVRQKIKDRLIELNLPLYKEKKEISSLTKGELFENRINYQSARSDIRRHAQKIFENSDKEKYCKICGYDKHYEVAHIKAVSEFNDDVLILEINDIDNLVALCPNHHWEYDNGLLNLENYL